jgi:DNA polymerase III gamma/tau subunit
MLTQKFRPNTFDEVCGQEFNIEILKSVISKPSTSPRVFVFDGSFGTGKTSLCRIFAKGLNCKNLSTAIRPCGVCESCLDSLTLSPFYQEFDSSDVGNKETILRLKDDFFAASNACDWRVVVFDECLSHDTSIIVNEKNYHIGDIVKNKTSGFVESVNVSTGMVEKKEIENYYYNGINKSREWRETTWDGGMGYFTKNHEILVNGIMTPLDNLPNEFYADRVMDDISGINKEALLGIIWGDSSIYTKKVNRCNTHGHKGTRHWEISHPKLCFSEDIVHRDYIEWKASFLQGLSGKWVKGKKKKGGGFGYRYLVNPNPSLDEYFDFTQSKRHNFVITEKYFNEMTPLSFAIWYIDDGYVSKNGDIFIACTNFDKEGSELVSRLLNSRFGYTTKVREQFDRRFGSYQYWICFNRESSTSFGSMISPYIVFPSYKYKDFWNCSKINLSQKPIVKKSFKCKLKVTQKPIVRRTHTKKYCIGVKDNHNFSLQGGLTVSNCHLMSTQAQSALLKILEEMPQNLFIVFCTTDGNKLLDTIRSRSIELYFKCPTEKQTIENLTRIISVEGIAVPPKILNQISIACRGHIRDSVKMLDIYNLLNDSEKFLNHIKSTESLFINFFINVRSGNDVSGIIEEICSKPLDNVKYDFYYTLRNMVFTFSGQEIQSAYSAQYQQLSQLYGQKVLDVFSFSLSEWVVNSFNSDITTQALLWSLVSKLKSQSVSQSSVGTLLSRVQRT